MLGYIRSKFATIPIPGNDITLDGSGLVTQAKEELTALREELKTTLDELTYDKLMEGGAAIMESSVRIMEKIPLQIYVG